MQINDDKAMTVCRFGQEAQTCRYLGMGGQGFECFKNTSIARTIDARIEKNDFNARGKPASTCGVPLPSSAN